MRPQVIVPYLLLLSLPLLTQAQWWAPVGGGFPDPGHPRTLYPDPISGNLWAGGSFPYAINGTDSVTVVGMAAWDGVAWDSIAHRVYPWQGPPSNVCQNTFLFQQVNGVLYANGTWPFLNTDSLWNRHLARLNENSLRWEALECPNPFVNGMSHMVHVAGDTLFITGWEGTMCGQPVSNVYSYYNGDIQRWPLFDDWPYDPFNNVGLVFPFQGQYYMTGLFNDTATVGGVYSILRHNGTQWEPVPGFEEYGPIKKVLIHNNKLYVGGYFYKATGHPGNCIAVFDGVQWDDLGGGMHYAPLAPPTSNGAVTTMFFNGDTLYCAGSFDHAGGIPASRIAKWNGVQWCSYPGDFSQSSTITATLWNDELYVAGGFSSIDGVPAQQIARYTGGSYVQNCSPPVSIAEVPEISASVQPNPFTAQTRLHFSEVPSTEHLIEVVDINGRILRTLKGNGTNELLLERENLSEGLYVLRISKAGEKLSAVRIVVE